MKLLWGLGILILISTVVWFVFKPSDTPQFVKGELPPQIRSVDFEGNQVSLDQYAGKIVILDFWAAWCPFCVEEMPVLEAFSQKYIDDVVVIGVHRTDSEPIGRGLKFAQDADVTYALWQDPEAELYKMAVPGGNLMPVSMFIDPEGIVREIKLGPKTEEDLESIVNLLIKETPSSSPL